MRRCRVESRRSRSHAVETGALASLPRASRPARLARIGHRCHGVLSDKLRRRRVCARGRGFVGATASSASAVRCGVHPRTAQVRPRPSRRAFKAVAAGGCDRFHPPNPSRRRARAARGLTYTVARSNARGRSIRSGCVVRPCLGTRTCTFFNFALHGIRT